MGLPLGPTNPRVAMPRIHAYVRGQVQGVFFRASLVEQARSLGLTGWVRNRADGSVEVVAEGPAEGLAALADYCRQGPPGAIVRAVEVTDEPENGEFAGFSVRSGI